MHLKVAAVVLAMAGVASGQSLGEVAEKEKARREKNRAAGVKVETVTGEDLGRTGGGTFTQMDGPVTPVDERSGTKAVTVSVPASGAASSRVDAGSKSDEARWRSRVRQARSRLVSLEAQVAQLDREATQSAFGSRTESCYVPGRLRDRADEQRIEECMKRRQNAPYRQESARGQTLARLASARAQLEAAKRSLEDLEEEARRAGVPPGWLRE